MHSSRVRASACWRLPLALLAVALCGAVAPAAQAAPLPLVSSTSYATAADDGYTCVTTGRGGAVYAAGYAQKDDALSSSDLLLVKYVDDGKVLTEAWHATVESGQPVTAVRVAVDASGNVIVAGNDGPFAFHGASSDIVVVKFSPAGESFGVRPMTGLRTSSTTSRTSSWMVKAMPSCAEPPPASAPAATT